jgi:predicted RNase H-like HicB family nuclease
MKMVISMRQESAERWSAWVPELPGCSVRGKSQQEVAGKIDQAIRSYLSSWDVALPEDLDKEVVDVGTSMLLQV